MSDSDADLFEKYARRVVALAESNIGSKLARRVDGEDVAQSVFRTFFRRKEAGEFAIGNSVELWALLVKITLAKVRSQARKHTAEKRDMDRELSDEDDWLQHLRTHSPGPVDAIMFADLIEQVVDGLPELYGNILSMRMHGKSNVEIATELGVSRQSVYRALGVLTGRLEKLSA